jgi:ribokinase
MPEIICIGSALVDIFIHSHHFATSQHGEEVLLCHVYGDKIDVEQFQVLTGGGASNTAVAFHKLGYGTGIVAELGKDNLAQLVEDELRSEGVDTSTLIHERKEQTGGSVIMIGPDGGRTVMVHRGAAAMLDVADLPMDILRKTRWIHLSSIGGRLEVLQAIFKLCQEQNVGLSWNPGKAELHLLATGQLAAESVAAHVLFVNKQEWESIKVVQSALQSKLYQVIVTNGADGGTVLSPQAMPYNYTSPALTSVDDTGAGDAFAAAYVAAYLLGHDPVVATRWGVSNAVSVVQSVGAKTGLLSRAEIEKIA